MTTARQALLKKSVIVLDGGLGTTLEDQHAVTFSSGATPLWSSHLLISDPTKLLKCQRSFRQAGADAVLTATYQASLEGFLATPKQRETDYRDEWNFKTLCFSAVDIARAAAGEDGLVVLSLGAYGATMNPSTEYSGEYGMEMSRFEALEEWHRRRLEVFIGLEHIWDEVDVVAFETLPRLAEVHAVRRLMQSVEAEGKGKKYWISCVFPGEKNELPDGTSVEGLLHDMMTPMERDEQLALSTPWAVGVNCTKLQKVQGLVKEFEDVAGKHGWELPHLVVYPDGASNLVYDTTQQKWAEVKANASAARWHESLADIVGGVVQRDLWKGVLVGGCCKTGPSHIKELKAALSSQGLV